MVFNILYSISMFFVIKKSRKKVEQKYLFKLYGPKKITVEQKLISILGKFLIARMLYADGLNAIIVMGGIFAVGVFNLEIKDLLKLSVLMNITAFIGAFIGGIANDKYGSKTVIIFSLVGLIFSSIAILFTFFGINIFFSCCNQWFIL